MANTDGFSFDSLDTGFEDTSFDDTSLDDTSFDDIGFDDGFEDNSNKFEDNDIGDRKSLVKTSIIMIVVGLVVIVGGIGLSKVLNIAANGMGKEQGVVENNKPVQNSNTIERNTGTQNVEDNGWISFSNTDGEILLDDSMTTTFTVTSVNHYVRVADENGNNIEVKTMLTGNISGFIGTYELELTYDKGSKVSSGMAFTVEVKYGTYNGKTVVGSIKY